MLEKYYPYEYVESIFTIDYQTLYNKGYKGIIFDIDNTLVPHGANSTEKVDNLFKKLQLIGINTILLTNNDEERVKRFIKNINTLYICDANKPNIENYNKAVEMLGINKQECIYIGDQIFTDIVGANNSGITSILVKYIGYYDKNKKGIKRKIEKAFLYFYRKNKKYYNRLGNIEINGGNE